MRLLVIFNPAAGRSRHRGRRLRRVVRALEERGCTVVIRETARRGDAEALARAAEAGFDRIVAAGGDGTINEIVNGLDGAARPLAILPLGTANILARELRLPRAPRRLAAVIAAGEAQPIWPAQADGRLFVACLGAGFDAEVVAAVDAGLKARFGKLAFVWAILGRLSDYRSHRLELRDAAGGVRRGAAVVVAKSRFYAGRFVLARAARCSDPAFHVVLFHRDGRLAALRYLAAMALGIVDRLPDVSVVAARAVTIAGEGPVPIELDGELAGYLPVTVTTAAAPLLLVHPSAL